MEFKLVVIVIFGGKKYFFYVQIVRMYDGGCRQ